MQKDGRTDGRTDMTRVTGDLRDYVNAPKKACSTGVGKLRNVCHTVVSEEILYVTVIENNTHYTLRIT
jgi:hypothetical protein